MQPSSLVFLAIIAMWAAYLLPQWVRRRDAMGQSRGRDRDSGGLRVLRPRSRRVPGPSTAPLLPQVEDPGSELDVVIRPESPQAIARRAAAGRPDAARRPPAGAGIPAGTAGSAGSAWSGESGAVAEQAGGAGPQSRETKLPVSMFEGRSVSSAGRVRISAAAAPRAAQVHATVPEPETGPSRPAAPGRDGSGTGPVRRPPARPVPRTPAAPSAAVRRARVLAILLLTTLAAWAGVALSLLEPVVGLAATALLSADLMALRAVARQRELARDRYEPLTERTPVVAPGVHRATRTVPALAAPPAVPAEEEVRRTRTVRGPLRRTVPPAAAHRPAPAATEQPVAETEQPGDGTWMPVPVPPPTYTLKPMAPRPQPPALTVGDARPVVTTGAVADSVPVDPAAPVPVDPAAPVPDRYEGTPQPSQADSKPARRPWEDDPEFADELDLDAVLARRRAVNG